MHSVNCSGKLAAATALLHWWKCVDFRGEKPFTILIVYMYVMFSHSFSFDPVANASRNGFHQRSRSQASHLPISKHFKDFHTFCKMCHAHKNNLLKCNIQELLGNEVYFFCSNSLMQNNENGYYKKLSYIVYLTAW